MVGHTAGYLAWTREFSWYKTRTRHIEIKAIAKVWAYTEQNTIPVSNINPWAKWIHTDI